MSNNTTQKKGYIYILTNKSFKPNWVKIGYSDDVERRVRELSTTSLPLDYDIFATYEIPANASADKSLHNVIQLLNPNSRINPKREFFEIDPWEAYELIRSIANIHNAENNLKLYSSKQAEELNPTDKASENELFKINSTAGELFYRLKEEVIKQYPTLLVSPAKYYVAFKKGKKHNVFSMFPKSGWVEVVLHAKLGTITDMTESIYDISNRGWTNAQYAVRYNDKNDIINILNLISQTYNLVK